MRSWSWGHMPTRLNRDPRVMRMSDAVRVVLGALYVGVDEHGRFDCDEWALRAELGLMDGREVFPAVCELACLDLVALWQTPVGQIYGVIVGYDADAPSEAIGKRPKSAYPDPPPEVWERAQCRGGYRGGEAQPDSSAKPWHPERTASGPGQDTVRTSSGPRPDDVGTPSGQGGDHVRTASGQTDNTPESFVRTTSGPRPDPVRTPSAYRRGEDRTGEDPPARVCARGADAPSDDRPDPPRTTPKVPSAPPPQHEPPRGVGVPKHPEAHLDAFDRAFGVQREPERPAITAEDLAKRKPSVPVPPDETDEEREARQQARIAMLRRQAAELRAAGELP